MVLHWWISGLIFIFTFALIISEKVHRTVAALLGAVLMVAAGKIFSFYSEEKAFLAINLSTLALLLAMMILVALLRQTGFFQYLAVVTAQKSRGKPWVLLVSLGLVTAFVSMFLDNVTTVILIAPLTIFIADMLGLSPVPFLMAEALLSNIGGTATLVGDPPNILIASAAGLTFNQFLVHIAPIVLIVLAATVPLLLWIFRREIKAQPQNIKALFKMKPGEAITDRPGLKKTLLVLCGVIVLFFIHHQLHLEPSFVSLLGAAVALLWVRPDLNEILREVEWSVLLFFAALFVTVGGLESSGLLAAFSQKVASLAVGNLLLAALVLLWVSAIMSAIVDNIPFAMAMIPVILHLETQGINTTPLWWALALGVGFGGNGTPIGATANVIVVSLSEKTRTPLRFKSWLKSGSLVMLLSCTVASLLFLLLFRFMK
jgi:Na+/H+ antiporter NhaD/arsenite permease-like protein